MPAYEASSDGTNTFYKSFEYDGAGRLTAAVDAEGNRITTWYSQFGGPSYTSDALKNGTAYDYYPEADMATTNVNVEANPGGALRVVTDATGLRTTYTYNFRGQALSETRLAPGGGIPLITKHEYYDNGDLKRTLELVYKSGATERYVTNSFAYDLNGNRLSETRSRHVIARDGSLVAQLNGEGAPLLSHEYVTNLFAYDRRNRLDWTTNALGEVSGSLYNANGKVTRSTNTLGQVTKHLYDVRGNLLETEHADGTVSRSVHDARGRVSWTQERALATNGVTVAPATETQYDALGRVRLVLRQKREDEVKARDEERQRIEEQRRADIARKATNSVSTNFVADLRGTNAPALRKIPNGTNLVPVMKLAPPPSKPAATSKQLCLSAAAGGSWR